MKNTNQKKLSSQSPSAAPSWVRTLATGFSIISVGVAIAIIGYIVLTTGQNQTTDQKPTAVSPSPPLPSNETADWKTYKVANLYELKIPPDKFSVKNETYSSAVFPGVIASESKSFISNLSLDEGRPASGNYILRVVVLENKNKLSTSSPKDLFTKLHSFGCAIEASRGDPIKQILLDNIKAYRMDLCSAGLAGIETQIITIKDDKIVEVIVEPRGGTGLAKQYLDQILSTFKFIE